jgi:hypothetical protein
MIHVQRRVNRELFFVLTEHCREQQRAIQSLPNSSDEQIILFLILGGSSEIAESLYTQGWGEAGTTKDHQRS